jgi:hypothetical protein
LNFKFKDHFAYFGFQVTTAGSASGLAQALAGGSDTFASIGAQFEAAAEAFKTAKGITDLAAYAASQGIQIPAVSKTVAPLVTKTASFQTSSGMTLSVPVIERLYY